VREYGGHKWDFEKIAWGLERCMAEGAVLVWIVGDATKDGCESGSSMCQALHLKSLGLNLHDTMIYEKSGAFERKGHRVYPQAWEYMFVFSKGRPKTFNVIRDRRNEKAGALHRPRLRQPDGTMKKGASWGNEIREIGARTNIWRYNTGWTASEEKCTFEHPAVMPEALAKDHIASWSEPGDVVLDPFAGSGTTLKAAKELGRRFIGVEVEARYIEIARARLAQEHMTL
jgi:site-specific DNA-methyltransferase (adenine-specific)